MEMLGIENIVNGKALVSSCFMGEYLNNASLECPKLPEKLSIDGRDVSVPLLH